MSTADDHARDPAAWIRRTAFETAREQGLPEQVTDPVVMQAVAAAVDDYFGSERSDGAA